MEQYIRVCVYLLTGLLGLCVGSFLNVVICRVPRRMSLAKPPSHCLCCGYSLRWYDNIPVLSWVILRGRCRKCRAPISARYILVEIINAALWLLSAALFWEESIAYACISALVCSLLICIFWIDLEHMLIFNRFTVLIALAGAAAMFFDGYTEMIDHIIGVLAGGGLFAGLYFGAVRFLQREGIGFGDVKLAAAAGLLLGWQKLILAILIASVSGSLVLLGIRWLRHDEKGTEYPFGPFLAIGILTAMLFGAPILTWYVNLLLG